MRTILFVIFFLSEMILTSCTHQDSLIQQHQQESREQQHWHHLLSTINSPDSGDRIAMTYSHPIGTKLLQVYELEKEQLAQAWQEQAAAGMELGSLSKRDQNRAKYQWMGKKVKELNSNTLLSYHSLNTNAGVITDKELKIFSQILAKAHQINDDLITSLDDSIGNYNEIGFCFGRALLTHYLLLKAGYRQEELGKIFILGELKVGATIWQYHMAVMVKTKGEFWVLDPMLSLPSPVVSPAQWSSFFSAYEVKSPHSHARIYVTNPRKFRPDDGNYTEHFLSHPLYAHYFTNMARLVSIL